MHVMLIIIPINSRQQLRGVPVHLEQIPAGVIVEIGYRLADVLAAVDLRLVRAPRLDVHDRDARVHHAKVL